MRVTTGGGVVRYRLRATLGRRVPGLVTSVLLIGLLGGVSLASFAAARRTQSSYATFLASTKPSDLTMSVYGDDPTTSAYSPALTAAIARLPQVTHVESWVGVPVLPLNRDGSPRFVSDANVAGSVDGLFFDQDRATAVQGRLADPRRDDEFETTAVGAALFGWHVGQVVPTGVYAFEQLGQPGFGTAAVPPRRRVAITLVGIVKLNDEVVEDEVDRLPTQVIYTPALTRDIMAHGQVQGTWYGMQLRHGPADVPAVERSLLPLRPQSEFSSFRATATITAKVERAIRPEAIALSVFGAIAALATLAVAGQSLARAVRVPEPDLEVLRALGAPRSTMLGDTVLGPLVAVVVGAAAAAGVAIALSPLGPLGPVRSVYPHRGVAIDGTVIALGIVALVVGLTSGVLVAAWQSLRHSASGRPAPRRSRSAAAAVAMGLPPSAITGLRHAFEPGRGRTSVPVRSALVGGIVAVGLVSATLTFGASLTTLVDRPPLYGWNWTDGLASVNGVPPQATALLSHDPKVAGWSGYGDTNLQVDGHTIPALLGSGDPAVAPPILSGRGLGRGAEIVLGTATLAQLHRHVGDTVTTGFGTPHDAPLYLPPTKVRIVGTATMPAVAGSGSFADHTSMGTGALVSSDVLPAAFKAAIAGQDPTLGGSPLVFVRYRQGVSATAALADLRRVAAAGNAAFNADPQGLGDSVSVLPVQRPAEIVNYRSTGNTPLLLAGGLTLGAIAALGLTLQSSVRRRRSDLALLKTVGFTRRQLALSVAWQSTVSGIVGVVIGLPLGIAAGRWLWILFARDIDAVPKPTIPASLALVGIGVLVLANVVAAIPGRVAARTPASLVLNSE